jgi:predicted  nucleic acid-binding Zn-ribbon protein
MEPEISHRCPSCGAAFRTQAQFCPQCGKTLKASASDALKASEAPESARRRKSDTDFKTTPLPPVSTVVEPAAQSVSQNIEEQGASDAASGNHSHAPRIVAVEEESTSKRQRVREAARGVVQENVRPRVEKLRQASSTMLEEASAIDPSLRFIIIAVFLFIIFVIMLLLSFVK